MTGDSRFRVSIMALAVALLLGGCVLSNATTWHKPGTDEDQWAADSATCKLRAQRLARERYGDPAHRMQSGGIDNAAEHRALMRGHDARQSMQGYYSRCLLRKGYQRGKPRAKGKAT